MMCRSYPHELYEQHNSVQEKLIFIIMSKLTGQEDSYFIPRITSYSAIGTQLSR